VIALWERACAPDELAAEIERARGRLMMLFAHERVLHALVSQPGADVLHLCAALADGESSYPSITPRVPAAHWYEREIHDLHGIVPVGHPRLEPLVVHENGENGVEHRGGERLLGEGVFLFPYGPVRSGIFESAQFLVQTGGEDVAYCAQRLFFKRRGAERRICEVPPELAVLVAERVSGTSSVAHALACCHAIEALSGCEVPERAHATRRVLAEIERCYNHLEATVRECEDASLAVAQAQFAALKERLHRLAAELVGNRYLRGAIVPGGVRIALDAMRADHLRSSLRGWEEDFRAALALLLRTDSFLDRLVGAGPLSRGDAEEFACVGPVARGSGVALDTRRDFPYDGYRGVEVATHEGGDAMARMEVRFAEVEHALRLIRDAQPELAGDEPTLVPVGPFTAQEALGAAESARGETLYWLQAADERSLGFCKLRAASFVDYGVFNRLFDGQVLTDFSFIEHSLALSPAGCDA
jgi:formate hydrogenlyase subunit 5